MEIFKHPLNKLIRDFPNYGNVLDVGSLNYTLYKKMNESHPGLCHYGIDYVDNTEPLPKGYVFVKVNLNTETLPFDDDKFDLIVASHVIEHLNDPLNFFSECIRVLKPNGLFYLEAPSENSIKIGGMNFDYDKFYSLSYYDDPTHTLRPYTAQSFYRLAKYYSANPIIVGYIISKWARILAIFLVPYARLMKKARLLQKMIWWSRGWSSYMIATKKNPGKAQFHYYIPHDN